MIKSSQLVFFRLPHFWSQTVCQVEKLCRERPALRNGSSQPHHQSPAHVSSTCYFDLLNTICMFSNISKPSNVIWYFSLAVGQFQQMLQRIYVLWNRQEKYWELILTRYYFGRCWNVNYLINCRQFSTNMTTAANITSEFCWKKGTYL